MPLLLREVRPVALDAARAAAYPVDLRVHAGTVVALAPRLSADSGDDIVEGGGRWLLPGLWDHHVHLAQWATTRTRLDTSGADSVDAALTMVRQRLRASDRPLVGFGHRSVTWSRQPATADLDSVTDRPVVLISGDAHHGWLNTAGHHLLGLAPGEGVVAEEAWFPAFDRLAEMAPLDPADYADAVRAAAARGVVGVTDLEFGGGLDDWPRRSAAGLDLLRVRVGVYPHELDRALAVGLGTGDPLTRDGLVTLGPLKVISDGALGTRTAHCCEPYAGAPPPTDPRGRQTVALPDLVALLASAHAGGIEAAVHAIGDAAVAIALDAFARTGAQGGVEHAQLVRLADLPRMAALGVRASVQPAHLLDDRDAAEACWPGRTDRCFAFRAMLDAGVTLAFGSDAPVAPLDPWLAMAAAVHRSADDREPWHAAQALTIREALAASTDGQGGIQVGSRGDLVLVDDDPLAAHGGDTAATAAALRATTVSLTMVSGRVSHGTC